VTSESAWFVRFSPVHEPRVRLFCFPYAGGGAAIHRRWQERLPAGVEVWSMRMPGREVRYREQAFFRMTALVDALEHEFADLADVPFAIFGHSLGALTGYETARRLEHVGAGPGHVFVSAHRAPHLPPRMTSVHLADDKTILRRLRRYGGTPRELYDHADLLAALLPSLRCDFAVSETYRFGDPTPLAASLTAFAGRSDDSAGEEAMDAWRDVVDGKFRLHVFEGGHFFWNDDPRPVLLQVAADLRWAFPELLGPT
jgi:surfactin synthase thioesterase subunit